MAHELRVAHVPQLRVVVECTFDALALDRAHAHILHLSILNQLTIMTVLVLDDLVDVSRWRRRPVLRLLLLPGLRVVGELAGFELRLLPLLVTLTIVVADLKDLPQVLRWLQNRLLA